MNGWINSSVGLLVTVISRSGNNRFQTQLIRQSISLSVSWSLYIKQFFFFWDSLSVALSLSLNLYISFVCGKFVATYISCTSPLWIVVKLSLLISRLHSTSSMPPSSLQVSLSSPQRISYLVSLVMFSNLQGITTSEIWFLRATTRHKALISLNSHVNQSTKGLTNQPAWLFLLMLIECIILLVRPWIRGSQALHIDHYWRQLVSSRLSHIINDNNHSTRCVLRAIVTGYSFVCPVWRPLLPTPSPCRLLFLYTEE